VEGDACRLWFVGRVRNGAIKCDDVTRSAREHLLFESKLAVASNADNHFVRTEST
jgi:hypothetical protein